MIYIGNDQLRDWLDTTLKASAEGDALKPLIAEAFRKQWTRGQQPLHLGRFILCVAQLALDSGKAEATRFAWQCNRCGKAALAGALFCTVCGIRR